MATENKPTVTKQELLEQVDNAIVAIAVGGQSYKIGSRQLTRADLKQLYAIKNDLTAQLSQENSGGLFDDCYVGIFDSR
ncbi:MAG: peptidylprolyl isomerase [Lachnospiraceae bacterium]|nr:peptidylprolyl isomerase [Lachnospiraceae bacterium]